MTTTPAYAVAYLRNVRFGEEIIEYLKRIDATMDPYGGRFLAHVSELVGLEGEWDGGVVIIEFPSMRAAQDWYASPEYAAILPLRTENSDSIAALVGGVPEGYRATDGLATLLAATP
ncbi:DUF1330 domain-containing protein [Luteipulveratus sp. YIM 133132]|uniref:DUF1330 domain-containing protein n=1 Tax=Luteipulveratus flavus TaxID=3031728 RepID=UPI0023B18DD5|nr:DUF1330 domain-containing protein [Luteipulveratus sp. YIM 133132]MDE9366587.1 DUF1330 domain-containing protein [Luteipulveratus sp. YIM 133132]